MRERNHSVTQGFSPFPLRPSIFTFRIDKFQHPVYIVSYLFENMSLEERENVKGKKKKVPARDGETGGNASRAAHSRKDEISDMGPYHLGCRRHLDFP